MPTGLRVCLEGARGSDSTGSTAPSAHPHPKNYLATSAERKHHVHEKNASSPSAVGGGRRALRRFWRDHFPGRQRSSSPLIAGHRRD